jgi:hypothetical protein
MRKPFYIVGNYEVKCVKGCVDIMGARLSPTEGFNDFVPVYSSRACGAIPIEIKSCEPEPEDAEVLKKLENSEFACRSQDVVLVLRRLQNSVIQHVQNYGPNSLGLSKQLVSAGSTTFPNLNFINCVGLYEKQAPFFKECGLRLLDLDMEFLNAAIFEPRGPNGCVILSILTRYRFALGCENDDDRHLLISPICDKSDPVVHSSCAIELLVEL